MTRASLFMLLVVGWFCGCDEPSGTGSSSGGAPSGGAPAVGGGGAGGALGGAGGNGGLSPEAIIPAPIDEPVPPPIPNTMISRPSPFILFGDCQVRGHDIPYLGADVIDSCTICQCTTYGGRCSRRVSCEEDVCVFVDGTRAAPGETVRVDGCFVCTCDAGGGSCVRDTEAPCPTDGCLVPYSAQEPVVVAFGESQLVSECHQCTCDEQLGASCFDLCHPSCARTSAGDEFLADQERTPADDGCGSCVCDYGSTLCDPRGCDPECIGAQQGCGASR